MFSFPAFEQNDFPVFAMQNMANPPGPAAR